MFALVQMLDPKAWVLLMVSVVILLAATLFTYLLWPQFEAYRTATQTYDILFDAVDGTVVLADKITGVQQRVEDMTKSLHGNMADLPRNQLEAFVVGRMQAVSWRHGIELRSVRPGPGSRVRVFDEVLFSVEVAGEYFDIYTWLKDLDEELGFVIVRRFELKPVTGNLAQPKLVANFEMVAYREAEDAS